MRSSCPELFWKIFVPKSLGKFLGKRAANLWPQKDFEHANFWDFRSSLCNIYKSWTSEAKVTITWNLSWCYSYQLSGNTIKIFLPWRDMIFPFYTRWKHQKKFGFLVFSGDVKWKHRLELGQSDIFPGLAFSLY